VESFVSELRQPAEHLESTLLPVIQEYTSTIKKNMIQSLWQVLFACVCTVWAHCSLYMYILEVPD